MKVKIEGNKIIVTMMNTEQDERFYKDGTRWVVTIKKELLHLHKHWVLEGRHVLEFTIKED